MPTWKIQLLGEFRCVTPDTSEIILPGRKHQALFAIVLLAKSRSITRERLLDLLWGSRSEDQARASLRGVLSEIRRACRPYGGCPIQANRTHVALAAEPGVDVDTDLLYSAIQRDDPQIYAAASYLNAAELLTSLKINERAFEQWKETEQTNLLRSYRSALIQYLATLEKDRHAEDIERVANCLLGVDDTDEDAHRTLMQLYHFRGNHSLALRQFELCESRLNALYGSSVSQETRVLAQQIKTTPQPLPETETLTASNPTTIATKQPGKPPGVALAVIPFTLPPGADIDVGITSFWAEEIAGAASRFKWFRVVPTSETFRLDVRALGASGVSAATGAKYVLGGRCRVLPEGYKLTVELADGVNTETVWSELITLSPQALLEPGEVLEKVVGKLDIKLRASEIRLAYQLDRNTLNGYECTLLALSNMYDLTATTYQETELLFDRAVCLNPNRAWFYSFWSLWKMFCLGQDWAKDHAEELHTAGNLARQAIKHDPDDALALAILGYFTSFWDHNILQGRKYLDQSLSLNPYSSLAWVLSAATYSHSGKPQEALRRLAKSRALCPIEPHFEFLYNTAHCIAHLFSHDPAQALPWAYDIVRGNPGFTNGYKHLLVALGHLEQLAECQRYIRQLLQLEPDFTIGKFIGNYPFANEEDRQFYCEGLRRAGVAAGKASATLMLLPDAG